VVAVAVLLGAGCGDDEDGASGPDDSTPAAGSESAAAPATLEVASNDYGYVLSDSSVPAGAVTITQTNVGTEDHQATVIQLPEGDTVADLVAGLSAEGDLYPGYEAYGGGPNSVEPGVSNESTQVLDEGKYAFICFIPDAEGTAHYQLGMAEPFEVTANDGSTAPQLPSDAAPEATVTMSEFAFEGADSFDGSGVVEVVNEGAEAHELTIIGDPTGSSVSSGGLATIAPGASALVPLELGAGDYQLVCFVTDEASGDIHVLLGMEQNLTLGDTG
jgi:uncharacterized cupredoxin-like copper-binding protein